MDENTLIDTNGNDFFDKDMANQNHKELHLKKVLKRRSSIDSSGNLKDESSQLSSMKHEDFDDPTRTSKKKGTFIFGRKKTKLRRGSKRKTKTVKKNSLKRAHDNVIHMLNKCLNDIEHNDKELKPTLKFLTKTGEITNRLHKNARKSRKKLTVNLPFAVSKKGQMSKKNLIKEIKQQSIIPMKDNNFLNNKSEKSLPTNMLLNLSTDNSPVNKARMDRNIAAKAKKLHSVIEAEPEGIKQIKKQLKQTLISNDIKELKELKGRLSLIENRRFSHRKSTFKKRRSAPNIMLKRNNSLKHLDDLRKVNCNLEGFDKESSKINSETAVNLLEIKEKDSVYRRYEKKKLVYDSMEEEEENEMFEENNVFYVHPDSVFIYVLDFFIFFCCLFSLFYFPLYLVENKKKIEFAVLKFSNTLIYFIDFIYIVDFLLGFIKAFYDFDEILITNKCRLIYNYITSYCFLDSLTAIPIYTLLKTYKKFSANNLNQLFLILKLFKVIKVYNNNKILDALSSLLSGMNLQDNQGKYFLKIILVFSILHLCACTFIFIGYNSNPNWLTISGSTDQPFIHIYITAIYFLISTSTSVGYGDIHGTSLLETVYQIIILIFGITAYSFLVSSISSQIKKSHEKNLEYEKKMDILDDIKRSNPFLNKHLFEKVHRHIKCEKYSYKKDKKIILESLPSNLKNDFLFEMYKSIIRKFVFFRNLSNMDFIIKIVQSFKPIVAFRDDLVLSIGDFVEDTYFLNKGKASIEISVDKKFLHETLTYYLQDDLFNNDITKSIFFDDDKIVSEEQKRNQLFFKSLSYKLDRNNTEKLNLGRELLRVRTKIYSKISKSRKNIHLHILYLNQNEQFGNILMFLGQRTPLNVRVKSKKAEFFLLNKMDVLEISSMYPSISKKINRRHLNDLQALKKLINKKIFYYCSINGIDLKAKNVSKNKENGLKEGLTIIKSELSSKEMSSRDNNFEEKYKRKSQIITDNLNLYKIEHTIENKTGRLCALKSEKNNEKNCELLNVASLTQPAYQETKTHITFGIKIFNNNFTLKRDSIKKKKRNSQIEMRPKRKRKRKSSLSGEMTQRNSKKRLEVLNENSKFLIQKHKSYDSSYCDLETAHTETFNLNSSYKNLNDISKGDYIKNNELQEEVINLINSKKNISTNKSFRTKDSIVSANQDSALNKNRSQKHMKKFVRNFSLELREKKVKREENKSSLFQIVNKNIKNSNLNYNNPNAFYSDLFSNILKSEHQNLPANKPSSIRKVMTRVIKSRKKETKKHKTKKHSHKLLNISYDATPPHKQNSINKKRKIVNNLSLNPKIVKNELDFSIINQSIGKKDKSFDKRTDNSVNISINTNNVNNTSNNNTINNTSNNNAKHKERRNSAFDAFMNGLKSKNTNLPTYKSSSFSFTSSA